MASASGRFSYFQLIMEIILPWYDSSGTSFFPSSFFPGIRDVEHIVELTYGRHHMAGDKVSSQEDKIVRLSRMGAAKLLTLVKHTTCLDA